MFINNILAGVIFVAIILIAIAIILTIQTTQTKLILAALIFIIGLGSVIEIIPIIIFWMIAGGIVGGLVYIKIYKTKKAISMAPGVGFIVGFVIFFVIAMPSFLIVPHSIGVEKSSQIDLLPQDDSGTLLYGTCSVKEYYNAMISRSEDSINCYYLYLSNESSGANIINSETYRLSSDDNNGSIVTYNRYRVRDYSPWYYQLFFSGLPEKDMVDKIKIIYVSNETIRMSPEFALYHKGSLNTS